VADWVRVDADTIRNEGDTVRVHKIADGWFCRYERTRHREDWRMTRECVGPNAAQEAKR